MNGSGTGVLGCDAGGMPGDTDVGTVDACRMEPAVLPAGTGGSRDATASNVVLLSCCWMRVIKVDLFPFLKEMHN